jgi:outer membrane protein OmpA-like peptidoglycan-associated protein
MTRLIELSAILLVSVLAGCASAPKPKELLDLEALRKAKDYERAQQAQPALVKESDEAHKKATEAWDDEEMDLAKDWAILSTIKLRTAQAIIDEQATRERTAKLRVEVAEVKRQHGEAQARIREAEEQLRLHGKLASARKVALEKEQQLTEAQKREQEQKALAEAQKKVAEAQLAIKMADTVEASRYASAEYAGAQALLTRAEASLKAGNATDAATTAEMAKSKAEAAQTAARSQYLAAKKQAERQAQNQALQKDAAAITGMTVKMKTSGETQQLIMPVLDLFARGKSAPKPEKVNVLNAIAGLLKKYPDYPVIINGYTSSRVARSQQYVVSYARAQAVATHFAQLGVNLKRMATSGQGGESPIAPKRSTSNDRVEVILLYQ